MNWNAIKCRVLGGPRAGGDLLREQNVHDLEREIDRVWRMSIEELRQHVQSLTSVALVSRPEPDHECVCPSCHSEDSWEVAPS